MQRHDYSLDQIKDMLLDRIDAVVHSYAPPAPGSYTDKGVYFTLNPGRPDKSVGSFCVHVSGPKAGRWRDYATGQHGDILDLIALQGNLSPAAAIREARAILGLQHDTPELRQQREQSAARAKAQREAAAREQSDRAERRRVVAEGLWLSGTPIAGSPVEDYLRGRAIDLRQLGHAPRSLRFHAECLYMHREVDRQTGEIFELREARPAMVAAICNGAGAIIACHRTWLDRDAAGRWRKARILSPRTGEPLPVKKVLGDFAGGAIRLGNGLGPRGGKGARLADCPPGSRIYIAEGIETALSARILLAGARVMAAVSLSNMGQVELPPNVDDVVLITDHDTHPEARAALSRAIRAHADHGRTVRTWASDRAGEDLNDALMRARDEEQETT